MNYAGHNILQKNAMWPKRFLILIFYLYYRTLPTNGPHLEPSTTDQSQWLESTVNLFCQAKDLSL
jgi:hypothetical protein